MNEFDDRALPWHKLEMMRRREDQRFNRGRVDGVRRVWPNRDEQLGLVLDGSVELTIVGGMPTLDEELEA